MRHRHHRLGKERLSQNLFHQQNLDQMFLNRLLNYQLRHHQNHHPYQLGQ
jgi:uncharacterized membrane protein